LSSDISFINTGTTAINLDSLILSSIMTTLQSIVLLLEDGKINDAYSIARKYHDIVVINIYEILYLEDKKREEIFIVEKINNWLYGKSKLPDYRTMIQYIRNHNELLKINRLLFKTTDYKDLRQRLNDHTHYNYFQYMILNDKYKFDFDNNRIKLLNQLSKDLKNIFIQHFCWLYTIKDYYMMVDNYIDYLEMNQKPPKNSQYWVRPYIQDIFNDIIKPNREDLANELKNSTCMKLK